MYSQGISLNFLKQLCFHVSKWQILIWNLKECLFELRFLKFVFLNIGKMLKFFWIGTSYLAMYHLEILLELICCYFSWKQKTWFCDVFRGNRRNRGELLCLNLVKLHAEFGGIPQIWIWFLRKICMLHVIISWTLFTLQLLSPITTSCHVEFEEKEHSYECIAIYSGKFRSSWKISERKTDSWIERPQFLYERKSEILTLGASCFRCVINKPLNDLQSFTKHVETNLESLTLMESFLADLVQFSSPIGRL